MATMTAKSAQYSPVDVADFVASRELTRLRLLAGEKLFLKGDEANSTMFVVIDGRIDVLLLGRVLDSIGPGGVVGEMALIDCTHRSAAALAQTDCELVAIDRPTFLGLAAEQPELALAIISIMSQRLARVAEIIRNAAEA